MKINMREKLVGLVITGSAALFGMMPMTVFAQVPEVQEQICICEEKCDEDHINGKCPVCSYDYTFCEGTDAIEEPVTEEPMGPLTPDGNLDLVDDYGSIEAGGKQFITVVTKSGNYFYIIIDRDDNGTENVHFLNMVDESDLLALMDEEQVEEYMNKTGVGEKEAAPVVNEPEKEEPEKIEEPAKEPEKKGNPGLVFLVVLLLGGGAGGYFYLTKGKAKKSANEGVDPDADYYEDEEDYLNNIPKDEDDIPEMEDEELEEEE